MTRSVATDDQAPEDRESAGSLRARAPLDVEAAPGVEAKAEAEAAAKAARGKDEAKRAGRGGIAIAGAKIFFMVVGLVQQIALKHILGLQTYGALGRVQGLASVVYNPVVSTAVQGVSRAMSAAPSGEEAAAQRKALVIHAVAVVPLAVGFFLAAPLVADLIRAPHLALPLRIVSAVVLFYGLYTPLVGALNGRRQYGGQALLDVTAATLRTVGMLGGAIVFAKRDFGVEGALAGFGCASALMVGIALPLAKTGGRGRGGPTWGKHMLFIAPLFGGQFALNLLFQSDLQLLGLFAAQAAVRAGNDPETADLLAGAYRNAQLFCFLPYQLLLSVTFVLFPMLATAHRDGDREAVARFVRTGIRLGLVIAGAMVCVTAGIPGALLQLVFGADSAALGATAMRIMAIGLGAFAVFGILVTVLTSLGREGISAALTVAALGLVVGLCFVFVRGQPFGETLLVRTALATGVGLFAATLASAWQVRRTAHAVVAPLTLIRVLIATAIAGAALAFLPAPSKVATIAYAIGGVAIYLAVLVGSHEIGRDDLALVRRVIGR
jgi:stage V sporulation protein B